MAEESFAVRGGAATLSTRALGLRVLVTVLFVTGAALFRYFLNPFLGNDIPWVLFTPAVFLSVWFGRLSCGLLAIFLSVVIASYVWLEPAYSFALAGPRQWISLLAFAAMGLLIVSLVESTFQAMDAERAERNRRERERRFFETALRSISDAFVVLDEDWRYTYANEVAVQMVRLPREQLIGSVIWALLPALENSEFQRNLLLSRKKRERVQFEYYYAPFEVWTEVRAYPMPGGTALYVVDISARKRIEAELARAQERLEKHAAELEKTVAERTAKLQETIAELERFSYTISHDLRAPLRAMESFSGFVAEDYGDKLDAQGHEYLDRIRSAAQRMDSLIRDVLVYSRTTRTELTPELVDLDQLAEDIVSQYSSLQPSEARIEIRAPLGVVKGNRTMLTQVLSNLLQNAVKFTIPGQAPRVEVWSEPRDARVRLNVRDHGIGIPKAAQEKIFGIFQQAHGREYEGTGIGLAIVKRAVERMNGEVGVQSEPGQGSTFWIELPAP